MSIHDLAHGDIFFCFKEIKPFLSRDFNSNFCLHGFFLVSKMKPKKHIILGQGFKPSWSFFRLLKLFTLSLVNKTTILHNR